jgi:pSer/pThr/pTyr-binding forkhead associated (FHA) protein
MYKYSCRKCPIRNRCIEESNNSTGTKIMIRTAFEARTDTLATWGLLQKNCLLLEADKARSKSALTDRLRRVQEGKEEETGDNELDELSSLPRRSVIRRLKPTHKLGEPNPSASTAKPNTSPDYLQPVSQPPKQPVRPLKRLSSTKPLVQANSNRYWLTVVQTHRHISLPLNGELSLGRFDPNVGIPPDIDLAYEDRASHLVSRRHASIIARNGHHSIEDLGSKSGIFVNGVQVAHNNLKPGDRISLGSIQLIYEQIPASILEAAKSQDVHHSLTVTPSGRKIRIVPPKDLVIGHADSQVNFMPDIDLSQDGEVARLVSRRHALIRWRQGQPYLEDLGSGFGTRISGEGLLLGQVVPLKPGDHIWVAGCVLAYDIEL